MEFHKILHKHALIKIFSDRDDHQPWICTGFLESAYQIDDLQKKKLNELWLPATKLIANCALNRIIALQRELKRLFFQNLFRTHMGILLNCGRPWREFCKILTKKDHIFSINRWIEALEIVEKLNKYFANIGPVLFAKRPQSQIELVFEHKLNASVSE